MDPFWEATMDTLSRYFLPLGAITATVICWGVLLLAQKLLSQRNAADTPTFAGPTDSSAAAVQPMLKRVEAQVRSTWSMAVATPIIFCAAYLIARQTRIEALGPEAVTLFLASGLVLLGIAISLWRGAISRERNVRWHISATQMVDRALSGLEQRGYAVLRDFAIDKVKIDYLLIGPKGVFTLQTVVYPAPTSSTHPADATVTYDGRTLFFPNEKDQLSIESAQTGAEIFSEWLSGQLGNPIAARAILALPGWQIKRISAEGISVIHPGQIEALFQYVKARPLSPEIIKQIQQHIQRHGNASHPPRNQSAPQETSLSM
jgi:hypothetical protein